MIASRDAAERPGFWREYGLLFRQGWSLMRAGGAKLAGLILLTQLVILWVATPVIGWLFREALRANGMQGLDTGQFRIGGGFPLTIAIIVLIVLLALWLLVIQFAAMVVLLHRPQISLAAFMRELGRTSKKLLRPSSIPLILYLFLLLPLTGFGFASVLTRGIAIPPFISGELVKTTSGAVALGVLLTVLALVSLRLALTMPVFVLTTGGKAARSSLRLTKGLRRSVPLALVVLTITTFGGLAALVLIIVSVLPTMLADAVAPVASPAIAAYSLGAAQVLGMLVTGFATAWIAGVLVSRVLRGRDSLAPGVTLISTDLDDQSAAQAVAAPATRKSALRHPTAWVITVAVVMAIGFGTAAIGTMQRLSETPTTVVLAHRGFTTGGVENTIASLEAAKSVGADAVEFDVMETKDGKFIVMHDANLARLSGVNVNVRDLTFDEITALTVRDNLGHSGPIPSLEQYVLRAQEIEMPLLLEIKLGGADSPDHVDRLVEELEALDVMDGLAFHSLDAASVARLKELRPDTTVGYIMPFAGGGLPETPANFIVVEQWTASEKLQAEAAKAGLAFVAWTINDEASMRELLRRSADGVITDHPDAASATREEMAEETGLSDLLLDMLTRFITVT